jgi:membrane-associated phospholipid phosphatase
MVPSPLLARATYLAGVAAFVACLATGLAVQPLGLAAVCGAAAALGLGAWFYRTLRIEPRIADSLAGTALIILFTAACAILSYALAATALPLQDALFANIDAAFGFHWVEAVAAFNAHPLLAKLLIAAYYSEFLQVPLAILVLGLAGRAYALDRFLTVYLASAVITVVLAALLPALGPYSFFSPDPAVHSQFPVAGGRAHLAHLMALRDGSFGTLSLEAVEGLVEFPSFHTALAINLMVAFWNVPYLRWGMLVLNALVIVATIPEGGHYLSAVIVGAIVALVCLIAYERVTGPTREESLFPRPGLPHPLPAE